jgi:hypothetical protein
MQEQLRGKFSLQAPYLLLHQRWTSASAGATRVPLFARRLLAHLLGDSFGGEHQRVVEHQSG